LFDDMAKGRITHSLQFVAENNAAVFEADLGADVLRDLWLPKTRLGWEDCERQRFNAPKRSS
jgi:hypothetical protein